MKKLMFLSLILSISLYSSEITAQSSNLTQAFENGFTDGYNFGAANNTAGYQAALVAVNSYTTGGGPGSGAEYLATYRQGLTVGWQQGQASRGSGCSLPGCDDDFESPVQSIDDWLEALLWWTGGAIPSWWN